MADKLYRYVGPLELLAEANSAIERLQPSSASAVASWLVARSVTRATFTFIVDASGALWLSDRGTEHVACARGEPVRAAGEVTFVSRVGAVSVASMTNQSTGYCPQPECLGAVQQALSRAGIAAPVEFTHAFSFRRCPKCSSKNLLKPELPECAVCGGDLPAEWNFD